MFELTMLTLDGKKHTEEISRITLPTSDGVRTILANHMDIVIPVEIGQVRIIREQGSEDVAVSEGMFNFRDNKAHLFVRTYEFAHEIDEARAERAREEAEQQLEGQLSSQELLDAELALKRALTRISTIRRG